MENVKMSPIKSKDRIRMVTNSLMLVSRED